MAKISFTYTNPEVPGEADVSYEYKLTNPGLLNPQELLHHFQSFALSLGLKYRFNAGMLGGEPPPDDEDNGGDYFENEKNRYN